MKTIAREAAEFEEFLDRMHDEDGRCTLISKPMRCGPGKMKISRDTRFGIIIKMTTQVTCYMKIASWRQGGTSAGSSLFSFDR